MRFYKIVIVLLMILLAGCATSPSKLGISSGQSRTLQGIFGVVTEKNSESGRFTWIQNGSDFSLTLYGPLGLGATNLSTTSTEYVLKTADGQNYLADSPEELMEDVLGWSIPVSGLSYWIWAEPEPDVPYTWQGNVLNQEGWQITYTQQDQKIIMVRQGVKVTIIIQKS